MGFAGFLWSLDDWYVTDNGLVVTETTNNDYTNMPKVPFVFARDSVNNSVINFLSK